MLHSTYEEVLEEISACKAATADIGQRYGGLYALLDRLCCEVSEDFVTLYSGLFARLLAVCRKEGIDYREADAFRRRARLVMDGEAAATLDDLARDSRRLERFVAALYRQPSEPRPESSGPEAIAELPEAVTAVVLEVGDGVFLALPDTGSSPLVVEAEPDILKLLQKGDTVSLLRLQRLPEGRWHCFCVVLEPDYLLDISTLSACMQPYGSRPENYLLRCFEPPPLSWQILLGNAANQMMDDCVNAPENATEAELYRKSMQQHFHDSIAVYAACPEMLPDDYFRQTRSHFHHIYNEVRSAFGQAEVDMAPEDILLEPAFVCPALGLRGRFDVMSSDHRRVLELKSGRAEDFGRRLSSRAAHLAQVALYAEVLHYNFSLPREQVRTYLFYSRYPALFDERVPRRVVREALCLRNGIVAMLRRLRQGDFRLLLPAFDVDVLNENRLNGRFFNIWLRPRLEQMCSRLQSMTDLEAAYASAVLKFAAIEEYLAKTGDSRPDSTRGYARLWRTPASERLAEGQMLPGLTIRRLSGNDGVETIEFSLPDYGEDFMPDFTEGEMVQFYRQRHPSDNAASAQLVPASISRLDRDTLELRLTYRQRNRHFFLPGMSGFVVEKYQTDLTFAVACRGVYALLESPEHRKALLLGQRPPEVLPKAPLHGDYGEVLDRVVAAVERAADYYLLVGPPGTGKTSRALRAMVEEFLAAHPDENLLLMAYTNRAVDEICEMLYDIGPAATERLVRVGRPENCHSRFRGSLLQTLAAEVADRAAASRLLEDRRIVLGTVAALTSHPEWLTLKPFRRAILDEASQVLEPQLLYLLSASRDGSPCIAQFVLIGDHKQLPAVVGQRRQLSRTDSPLLQTIGVHDLRQSLFERLYRQEQQAGRTQFVGHLEQQGRMHADICRHVSHAFYEGHLRPVPLSHQEGNLSYTGARTPLERFVSSTRMGFIDVPSPGNSISRKVNRAEARVVAAVAAALQTLCRRSGCDFSPSRQLGVIVPFRAQISAVRNALRSLGVSETEELAIDTVECYQGSQRDYILFCTTVSRPCQMQLLSTPEQVGGVCVDRKLNVALTRARKQIFVVGNAALLRRSPLYARLLDACSCATACSLGLTDQP